MNHLPFDMVSTVYKKTKTVKTLQFIFSIPFAIVFVVCMVLLNGTQAQKFSIFVFSVFLILLLIDAVLTYTRITSRLLVSLFDRNVKPCLGNAIGTAMYLWVAILLVIFTGCSWASFAHQGLNYGDSPVCFKIILYTVLVYLVLNIFYYYWSILRS